MVRWGRGQEMKTEQTTIRLPVELKDKMQKEADDRGYTINNLIVFILWDYFENTAQE